MRRRAEKAEQLQPSARSPPTTSSLRSSQCSSSRPHLSETARNAVLDSNSLAECTEQARDEAEALLSMLEEQWAEFERWFPQVKVCTDNVCAQFSHIISEGGSELVRLSSTPLHPAKPPLWNFIKAIVDSDNRAECTE